MLGHGEAEGPGGLEVAEEVELYRLLDREISELGQEPEPSPTVRALAAKASLACRGCTASRAAGQARDHAFPPRG